MTPDRLDTDDRFFDNLVFYSAMQAFRNRKAAFLLLLSMLMSANFTNALVQIEIFHKPNTIPMVLLWLGAVLFIVPTVVIMKGVVLNEKKEIEINSEGVRFGEKRWTWNEISSIQFAPVSFSDKVRIQIGTPIANGRLQAYHILQADCALTRAEYLEIITPCAAFLHTHYPAVRVLVPPRQSSNP